MGARRVGKKRKTTIADALVEYDDAVRPIEVPRSLVDVWKGQPGVAGKCMNAQCIMRNKKLFPHKVLAVSVIKSRVFIMDTHDHAVRYVLSRKDSRAIQAHDEEALGQPGTLTLRPPAPSNAAGITYSSQHRPHKSKRGGQLKKTLSRGEKARVAAAVGAG